MLATSRKFYAQLPQHRQRQLIWLGFAMFAMGFIELGLAGSISLLGVALADPASLNNIDLLREVFKFFPTIGSEMPQQIQMLFFVLILVCTATVIKNLAIGFMTYWQCLVAQEVAWDISLKIFNNYIAAPYIWHTQNNPGELFNYLNWRIQSSTFFTGLLQSLSQAGIMLFLLVGAFTLAPAVSVLLYGVSACVALLIYKMAQRRARDAGARTGELSEISSRVAHAALHGIREVKIYNQKLAFIQSYQSLARPTALAAAKQGVFPPLPQWWLESTGMLLLLCGVLLMVVMGDSVASITGTLTLMAAVSWRLLPALNKTVGGVLMMKAHITPVSILLRKCLSIPDLQGETSTLPFHHSLDLQHIDFTYPDSCKPSLRDINITIPKRSMVGFVGLSGAGKSTLVSILTGLVVPTSGKILVDGKEVHASPGFLKIGYVPQNPYILDATLAENVAFADWGKGPDQKRVLECCKLAAMDFLEDLPQGIHTVMGDRGVRLSGGQVQRVAIARALYDTPDLLLFDEATSALDGATEAAIQSTILSLRDNMTIVIVAHRLSTVEACSHLYWLQDGQVVKQGNAAQVLPEYQNFLKKHLTDARTEQS